MADGKIPSRDEVRQAVRNRREEAFGAEIGLEDGDGAVVEKDLI